MIYPDRNPSESEARVSTVCAQTRLLALELGKALKPCWRLTILRIAKDLVDPFYRAWSPLRRGPLRRCLSHQRSVHRTDMCIMSRSHRLGLLRLLAVVLLLVLRWQ